MKWIAWAIHDLNYTGGHERSTREIIGYLCKKLKIEICTFDFSDATKLGNNGHIFLVKPRKFYSDSLKVIYFFVACIVFVFKLKIKFKKIPLFISTGTASLYSDIVQVQFVNAAWKEKKNIFRNDIYFEPGTRGVNIFIYYFKKKYQELLLEFHIFIEKIIYSEKKHYIAISKSVGNELEKYFSVHNISVIYHGVNTDIFFPPSRGENKDRNEIRRFLNISIDDNVIIFVGAFERKGLGIAIDAFSKISAEKKENSKFIVIGSGDIAGFQEKIRKYNIEKNFIFLQNQTNIEKYYRTADIFLMPTLYEPFGLVILEAMASGLAVIVSELAGAAELIENGENGLLIDNPKNIDSIAIQLERLLNDKNYRQSIQKKAVETAHEHTWDKVAEKYATLIHKNLII